MSAREPVVAPGPARRGERGSAMLLAILVSVILTLLGVSFLMMAQTENLIAQNERLAAQALYAAEAGARAVKRWFDRPGQLVPVDFPQPTEVDRSLRVIDDDGAGPDPPVAASTGELYKDGTNQLFRPPYRGTVTDTLLGTEDGPDMRIRDSAFLNGLSQKLFADFPDAAAGVQARITAIDIYAPPYLETPGGWARFGMGTVKVTARILDDGDVIAERTVRAVLNELPYRGPYGPLHSGAELTFETTAGPPTVYWGAMTAMGTTRVSTSLLDHPKSLPRSPSGLPQFDPLWGPRFQRPFPEFKTALPVGTDLGDPWFRLLSEGTIQALGSESQIQSNWQDWPGGGPPLPQPPDPPTASPFIDRSNILQDSFVICPLYDYETWKAIATGGGINVRYFAHAGGQNFKENGRGTAASFRSLTHGGRGIFFFDTTDGRPPAGDDSNLTPPIVINGGTWGFEGVIYLNARKFQAKGNLQGAGVNLVAPGEPFEDLNQNGKHDPDVNGNGLHDPEDEGWIDLSYPTVLGAPFTAAVPGVRNTSAPIGIGATASLRGILYTNGKLEATGQSRHYGSFVARGGVVQEDGSAVGTPEIYFDASIVDDWPPAAWGLPRVVITRWLTDS